MKLSVMIPTYNRPETLELCLGGLARQKRGADQIVVVVRPDDAASLSALKPWLQTLPITTVFVDQPGVVQALNKGLAEVTGDIITITDDDSVASADWLACIEEHFAQDPRLGGLGGRDVVHAEGKIIPPSAHLVGRILPFGRIVGNHHIGLGDVRQVDVLKGVNMSWRMDAIRGRHFDTGFRGKGAQVFFELGFSLEIKGTGWRLKYDPALTVDHFPARRFDNDQRGAPSLDALEDATFNLYLALLRNVQSNWRVRAAIAWARVFGTRSSPGAVRGWLSRIKRDRHGLLVRHTAINAWKDAKIAAEKQ
jgi:glycosyltransferase involved in cell wall biosynthesis